MLHSDRKRQRRYQNDSSCVGQKCHARSGLILFMWWNEIGFGRISPFFVLFFFFSKSNFLSFLSFSFGAMSVSHRSTCTGNVVNVRRHAAMASRTQCYQPIQIFDSRDENWAMDRSVAAHWLLAFWYFCCLPLRPCILHVSTSAVECDAKIKITWKLHPIEQRSRSIIWNMKFSFRSSQLLFSNCINTWSCCAIPTMLLTSH